MEGRKQRRMSAERMLLVVVAVVCLVVRLHVSGELAGLCACVVTQLTLVRFLSRVRASVDGEIATVLEDLTTKLARVILLTRRTDFRKRRCRHCCS